MTWFLFEDDLLATGRICYECANFTDWNNFHVLKHGRNQRASICKPCKSEQRKIQRSLRKLHVPPEACDACQMTECRLQLDHCHESGEFRAYLCATCNLKHRRWQWGRVAKLGGA